MQDLGSICSSGNELAMNSINKGAGVKFSYGTLAMPI